MQNTKGYVWLGSAVVLIVAVTGFVLWANHPVKSAPSSSDVKGISSDIAAKPLTAEYFTTMINDNMTLKSQNQSPHGHVLSQSFLSSSSGRLDNPVNDQIGITIGSLSNQSITELSDVQFRSRRPDTYQQISSLGFPKGSLVFVKTQDGYEKSVFWQQSGRYSEVVISGTADRASQLNDQLKLIIDNWQWRAN